MVGVKLYFLLLIFACRLVFIFSIVIYNVNASKTQKMTEEIAKSIAECLKKDMIGKRMRDIPNRSSIYRIIEITPMRVGEDIWDIIVIAQKMDAPLDINEDGRIKVPLNTIKPTGVQYHELLD